MRSPLESGPFVAMDVAESTQDLAAEHLRTLRKRPVPGAIFAHHQTQGRGRFGRTWLSARGDSLTMSLVFSAYAEHPKPWLLGMGTAIAAAESLDCLLRWPNDLVLGGKKLGGILTELFPNAEGQKVAVVGIGINLNQGAFPQEIEEIATSLAREGRPRLEPLEAAWRILRRLGDVPEPDHWRSLRDRWMSLDDTPGKVFQLPDGRCGVASGVGEEGELLCDVDGQRVSVYAAEALLADSACNR